LISINLSDERSAEVHCDFEQYDKTLFPGMFMNGEVEVKSNDAATLPDDAMVRYENKQFAFLANNSHELEMLEIKTGKSENDFTEIMTDDASAKKPSR
jgi:membrane fusion protein, heavy metal efflux system